MPAPFGEHDPAEAVRTYRDAVWIPLPGCGYEFKESSPAKFATAVINSLGSTGFGTNKIGQ